MADRDCPPCLNREMIVPISRQATEVFKTSTWTSVRPCFIEKISSCQVGDDIPTASWVAAQGDFNANLAVFPEESPLHS